jgi:hypothetical protein
MGIVHEIIFTKTFIFRLRDNLNNLSGKTLENSLTTSTFVSSMSPFLDLQHMLSTHHISSSSISLQSSLK